MKLPVDYNDPQSLAKLHVDALIASSSRWAGTDTGTTVPGAAGVTAPYVSVRFEAWVSRLASVAAIARIRLGVWSLDQDEAWDLASFLQGRLLALPGDDEVSGYLYELGPERSIDPASETPFCAFTIRQKVRARIIEPGA